MGDDDTSDTPPEDNDKGSVVEFPGRSSHPSQQTASSEEGEEAGVTKLPTSDDDDDEVTPEQFDLDFDSLPDPVESDEASTEAEEEADEALERDEAPAEAEEELKEAEGEEPEGKEPEEPADAGEEEAASVEPEPEDASGVGDFAHEQYLRATTEEYEDLARAVEEAEGTEVAKAATSVAVPGMDAGVLGFEDVAGRDEAVAIETPRSDLPVRVGTALGLAVVFLGALFAPQRGWLALLVGVAALAALLEYYGTVRSAGFNPVVLLGLVGATTILAGGWFGDSDGPYFVAALAIATVAVVMLWYVLTGMKRPLENGSMTLLGVLWIPVLMAFAMPIVRSPDYRALILFLVIVNAAGDIGAYFVGRGLGRTRLAPALSPKKTVEGLVGGAILAVGVGAGLATFSYFSVLEIANALVLSLVIVAFSVLGDLTESLVKRSLGVKDMGSILPGHGGILDRIDGLIFVLPAAYYTLRWIGIL